MALDVHVLDSDTARPVDWPACQFEETIHSAIFFGGVPVVGRYPFLRRMQDYYADARYSGADLRDLVAELQDVLPMFANDPPVHQVLRRFAEICRRAASQGKVVLCLCD
jgi:hypothetical protein